MELRDKVAIVTGASRGIGKAIAVELGRAGASVAVVARTVEHGQSRLPGTIHDTVKEIQEAGGKAIALRGDVARGEDITRVVEQVNKEFGPIDILVNNAGITSTDSFLNLKLDMWDRVMTVNLRGTVVCTKAVLPQMVERKSGSIINMSSVLANRIKFSIVYGTSKAAIERFTLGLAKELQKFNISVNALCPDFTVTEAVTTYMPDVDTSSWQLPETWGRYTVFVATRDAQSMTGRILTADDVEQEMAKAG